MPGKVIPCVLCQEHAAVVFCVNDDAHLCTSCDASVHAGNPLLARHERRPLAALHAECASVAHTGTTSASDDVGVVPQLAPPAVAAVPAVAPPAPAPAAAFPEPPAAPLSLYEDSFLGRSLTTSDLLDLDDLELPGASSAFSSFDPLDDCVVPCFGADLRPAGGDRYLEAPSPTAAYTQQSTFSYMPQPSYMRPAPYHMKQQQPAGLVPMAGAAPKPVAPTAAAPLDPEAEAARVQRHRDRQRKKRAFGRAVRYQSRRAYAEIRPRIKGRFVTPEEYAVYQAQMAAEKAAAEGTEVEVPAAQEQQPAAPAPVQADKAAALAPYAPPAAMGAPLAPEEDAVVPMPSFVAAM